MDALTCLESQTAPQANAAMKCTALSLADYYERPADPADTLLGHRFLCREGGLLFVGPSGVGKSSASVQQDVCWALGRPAFGIEPARPLRILCVQAENDAGDMYEMARGVMDGLNLSAEDRLAIRERTLYASNKASTGPAFFDVLRRLLDSYKPDLIRIDPLQAYLGGDPKDSALMSWFCRESLNPLLEEYAAGAILNHHTPKTNFRDTAAWKASDWMYAGAGAADLTNWARAILVIDHAGGDVRGLFRFIAAKRGGRIGWRDEENEPVYERYFQHAREFGTIYWEDAECPARSTRSIPTKDDLLALVPEAEPIRKDALTSKAGAAGIGEKKVRGFIGELLGEGKLHEWFTPRKGTKAIVSVARKPQPAQTEIPI